MAELTSEQKRELRQWERRMRLACAVIGTIFFLYLLFGFLTEDMASVVYAYLLLFAVSVLWGAHVRYKLRCPACGSRIGSWWGLLSYFGLPPGCRQCGASFR
jgi:hypothetical protein